MIYEPHLFITLIDMILLFFFFEKMILLFLITDWYDTSFLSLSLSLLNHSSLVSYIYYSFLLFLFLSLSIMSFGCSKMFFEYRYLIKETGVRHFSTTYIYECMSYLWDKILFYKFNFKYVKEKKKGVMGDPSPSDILICEKRSKRCFLIQIPNCIWTICIANSIEVAWCS